MTTKVSALFKVASGNYHAIKELDAGKIPLVSCGNTDNGVMGYYDIPPENRYRAALTVAYNGSWPIMCKFHPYEFGTKDDIAVLVPLKPMSTLALLYVAALLNRMTWRYSYGRKCFREKLMDVEIPVPVITEGSETSMDEVAILEVFPNGIGTVSGKIIERTRSWLGALS